MGRWAWPGSEPTEDELEPRRRIEAGRGEADETEEEEDEVGRERVGGGGAGAAMTSSTSPFSRGRGCVASRPCREEVVLCVNRSSPDEVETCRAETELQKMKRQSPETAAACVCGADDEL